MQICGGHAVVATTALGLEGMVPTGLCRAAIGFDVGWFIQLLRLAKGGSTAKLATLEYGVYVLCMAIKQACVCVWRHKH